MGTLDSLVGMQASQVYDDLEATILAADENPEYRDQIVDSFIDQVLRRKKRRFAVWRTLAILLSVAILGTVFIDRLISFPLSLFALIFLWLVVIGAWVITRLVAFAELYAIRFTLMWLLTRTALRRAVSGSFGTLMMTAVKAGLKQVIKWYVV